MPVFRLGLGGLLALALGCGATGARDAGGGSAGSAVGGAASNSAGSSGAGGAAVLVTSGTGGAAGESATAAGANGAGAGSSGTASGDSSGSGGVSGNGGMSGSGGVGQGGAAGSAGAAGTSGVGGGAHGPACAIPQKIGGSCRFNDYCHDRWGGAWDDPTIVMNECSAVDTFDTAPCPTAGAFGFCASTLQQGGTAHDAAFQYSAQAAASVAPQCASFGGTWCAAP
jgi:hypothetical protein